jgi:hypothetical protein
MMTACTVGQITLRDLRDFGVENSAGSHQNRPRGETNFASRVKAIAVIGQLRKNIYIYFFQNSCFLLRIPPHRRGAYASSRHARRGCGGRDQLRETSAAGADVKSCGPDIPVLVSSFTMMLSHHVK